ncbi:hypothetical protein EV356DRAFT_517607 [Viridothelium virens]|uniref:Zn(2)-C6 fungal-type domain-containing protein n=1 Tax=Viridothelium virens TaxID=1048519 RepID=A0A6A6H342_VIRVR|nr:hypothetical protein EV356DRAFT_517607 [Viridothelium virens]
MTPTPPSTTSSSGASPEGQYRVVRKRNRVPLSCGPCRHRKLKCNRGHPCDNCTKRGDTPSCTYAAPNNRKKGQSTNGAGPTPDDMQNRIDRLEGLVLSLMTNGNQAAGPAAAIAAISGSGSTESADAPIDMNGDDMIKEDQEGEDSEVDQVAKSIGIMKVDNGKSLFISDAHWYTILSDIAEVKNYFAEHHKQFSEQYSKVSATKSTEDRPGTAFLLRAEKPASHQEILASFPTKGDADRLVARYFNTYDPATHIIHGPTFQKQYDQHWITPNETPSIWLGMVFAMMTLALQSYGRAGDEPPEYRGKTWDMSTDFRRLTAQCLLFADFTQPLNHVLETLILHVQSEYARTKDTETGVLILVTILVRMAIKMGYHRDPRPFSSITPFQGEMRRRVWTFVRHADMLFSFQSGLPLMIRACDFDTEVPRNLYDDELYEDMKALPPPRPSHEATPVSYMASKARLAVVFGKVVEAVQTLCPPSYDDILKLDEDLRRIRGETPPHLAFRAISDSSRDPANLIMQRYSLELMYQKALCVLHRKFLGRGREQSRYVYSRRTCIDAAMELLQQQTTIQKEVGPGGRLRSVKWFVSSLTTHDFLIAAMIVCLDLYITAESARLGRATVDMDIYSQERRESMFAALEQSYSIWESLKDHSVEAFKAATILRVMLDKLETCKQLRPMEQGFPAGFPMNANLDDPNVAPEHSAAMTLGMLSSGGVTPNAANMFAASAQGNTDSKNFATANLIPNPGERTGLTPQYSGPDLNMGMGGLNGSTSPFSQLFGPGSTAFQGLDVPSGNIDWDAWDSYIQGTTVDPTNQLWPMNFDPPEAQTDGATQSQQPAQQTQNPNNSFGPGSIFMGVNTPPGNSTL